MVIAVNRTIHHFIPYYLFLLILCLIGYVTSNHTKPSSPIFVINVIIYSSVFISFFTILKPKNYMNFDFIFLVVYFIVGYFPGFFYSDPIYPFLFLHFPFKEIYINSGYWLFTIGSICYVIGRAYNFKVRIRDKRGIIPTKLLLCIYCIILVLYIVSGGLQRYENIYANKDLTSGNGVAVQLEILLSCIGIVLITSELYNKKFFKKKYSLVCLSVIFSTILLLLIAGNRTIPSYLILSGLCVYTSLFYPLTMKKVICLMVIGVVGMWGVMLHRSNSELSFVGPARMLTDLTINTRNTYIAQEIVEQNGYSYGKTMLNGVTSIVPLGSYILNINPKEYGSAEVMTAYTYKNLDMQRDFIGLGTNIIADLYLSFGLFGVLFFMVILGMVISTITKYSFTGNYDMLIIYACISAYSVFLIRTGYTLPLRIIFWGYLIAVLFSKMKKS